MLPVVLVTPTHHINGADVMLLDGCHVLSVAANGQDATMHARVQRLHAPYSSSSSSSSSSVMPRQAIAQLLRFHYKQ
jgi:hypothetical protein